MISIHERKGSFSDRWIAYCQEKNIPHKIVNCYDTNIINQLSDCDGLMWHWNFESYRDQNFARQLIFSVEKMGIKVFPSFNNCWHYDDKVGQKYLLEAIDAPLVSSHIFYDKISALEWIHSTSFPKVFKLRGGAGSLNVKLVHNRAEAISLVKRAFNKGFPLFDKYSGLKQRLWIWRRDKNLKAMIHFFKGVVRLVWQKEGLNLLPRQIGYIYFQDFIPGNKYDDRIVVIGNRAIAVRRYNRINDFRASGSGIKKRESKLFDINTIKIAFDISKTINTQSIAFDFIYNEKKDLLLVEISYAYIIGEFYDECPGYWDRDLNWHEDSVDPQRYIIEDFISDIKQKT